MVQPYLQLDIEPLKCNIEELQVVHHRMVTSLYTLHDIWLHRQRLLKFFD